MHRKRRVGLCKIRQSVRPQVVAADIDVTKFNYTIKTKKIMTKEKFFTSMGWVGMVTSILMYIFYFPQIENNLDGHKGTFIQPFMAGINCTLWVCYGLFKEKRDLPLAIANTPGIIFGFVAAFTAL